MVEALDALPLPALSFQVNNRKLIQGFYHGLGIPDVPAAIRAIDKLDKQPADAVAALLVETAGATAEQAEKCLALATVRVADTSFVETVRGLGVEDELLETGLARARGGDRRLRDRGQRPRHGRGQPAHRARARLLHRHGARDLHGRLRAAEVRRLAAAATTPSPATAGRRTPASASRSASRARWSRWSPTACSPAAAPSPAPCWSRSPTRIAPGGPGGRRPLRRRGIPTEVAASPQKFGKQIRYAERRGIPFVWFPGATRTTDRHEVKDIRSGDQVAADPDAWTPPDADLHQTIVTPTRSSPRDPHPRRRHPHGRRRRPDRHPRRLGRPPPRPRRRRLPRPPRGQRHRPGGRPRRERRPQPAQRVLHRGHRHRAAASRGQRQPQPAVRRDRGRSPRPLEVLSAAAPLPFPIDDAGSQKRGDVGRRPGCRHRYLDLRRTGPNHALAAAQQGQQGRPRRARPPRLRRDRDADADAQHARGRPRLPGARRGCSPAAGTPCRRARSCSSSC